MLRQINQPFTNQDDISSQHSNFKITGIIIGIVLTMLASLLWSGLALFGIGLLSFSFALISTSMVNHRLNQETNWGIVITGQLISLGGILILLISYFL